MSNWERVQKIFLCTFQAVVGYFVIRLLLLAISVLRAAEPPTECDIPCMLVEATRGMSCMQCEILVFKLQWLWAAILSLVIIGIIINFGRCIWQTVRGDNNKEEKTVTVSITSSGPLLFYPATEFSGSPVTMLNGEGNPTGGTYQWSILSGTEKIHLDNEPNQASLEVKPVAPSDSIGDIILRIVYTTQKGTVSAQESLTVYKPDSAVQISTQTNTINGPVEYGYEFKVRYKILDQFGERFPQGDLLLTEKLSAILNPYNTQFDECEYQSDANAEYVDNYKLTFKNQLIPTDYIAKVRQVVKAQGAKILDQILVWRNTHVDFE